MGRVLHEHVERDGKTQEIRDVRTDTERCANMKTYESTRRMLRDDERR